MTVAVRIKAAAASPIARANLQSRTVTLTIDGLSGRTTSGVVFEIYVNKGRDQRARPSSRAYVGSFTLFGVQPGDMPGMQMTTDFSVDITRAVASQRGAPSEVEVMIVPRDIDRGGRLPAGTLATIERLVISIEGAIAGGKKRQRQQRKKQRNPARPAPTRRRKNPAGPNRSGIDADAIPAQLLVGQASEARGNKRAVSTVSPNDPEGAASHPHH
jgi:hypothetical protein